MINKKFIATIRQVGGSKMITIPIELIESEHLVENKTFEFAILKELTNEQEWKNYKCVACGHEFTSNDIVPFCAACGNENIMIVK